MAANFDRFMTENCGIRDIVNSWIDKAMNYRQDGFERFHCLWSAFNSWALIVTLEETDKGMVTAIGKNRRVADLYQNIINRDTGLAESLGCIKSSFPLHSFADLVRLDSSYDWRRNARTKEYFEKIANAPKSPKVSPSLVVEDWNSVIQCMYAVRCNLIHGSKMASDEEREFVGVFATLLDSLMTGTASVTTLHN